jgi:hypothetical protein
MAAVSGRHGYVKWGADAAKKKIVNMNHWDLTLNVDMLDVTPFSTDGAQWRAFLPGLSGWSGTFSGFADAVGDSSGQKAAQTAILTPATGAITLYLSETGLEQYRGAVYFQALNVGVDVADSEKASYSFQGTAALTYATADA